MRLKNLSLGALTGGLLTTALVALMYLADQFSDIAFAPFDLFDWIAGLLPGPIITFGIDLLIDTMLGLGLSVANTAKTAEQAMAVGLFLGLGTAAGAGVFAVSAARTPMSERNYGIIITAVFGVPMLLISMGVGMSSVNPIVNAVWLGGLFIAWGMLVARASIRLRFTAPEPSHVTEGAIDEAPERPQHVATFEVIDRRQFLIKVGATTAVITVAGAGLGRLLEVNANEKLERERAEAMARMLEPTMASNLPNANDPVIPAPGTRLEYTAVEDHYKVFLRLKPTTIDPDIWTMPISGLVENPMVLNLEDFRNNWEPRSQYVTLSCISGRIASDLISTTRWTGASLQDIVADLKPKPEAQYLVFVCKDGFFETVDLDLIASDKRIMLAYDWDGMPIPYDHGAPLRIWLPDRYGMKQPKWITQIEVVDEYKPGYWVQRGWDEVAEVKTTSVIDTVAAEAAYEKDGQTMIPIGGIAFAGAKGISKVEIKIGDRPWQEAQLRTPLSETTWVIWRYDWPFEMGRHFFEVRTVEADGTPQIEKKSSNRPSGATGLHKVEEWL